MEKHERIIAALVGKIKEGNGGEASNARITLKKLCVKYDLDFDEVLTGKKIETRWYKITAMTEGVVAQVIMRYGSTREIFTTRGGKLLATDLDEAAHLEVTHALDILVPLYKKEMRKVKEAVLHAFVAKHDLYFKGEYVQQIGEEKKKTPQQIKEERERSRRAIALAQGMEDATIYKRLT